MKPEEIDSLNQALLALNDCIEVLHKRIERIEEYLNELSTPDKILYKPKGHENYLNIKENYDEIYRRLGELENGV